MSFWRFILWILTVSHFLKLTFSDFAKSPLAKRLIVNKVVGGKGTNVLDVPLLRLGVLLRLLLPVEAVYRPKMLLVVLVVYPQLKYFEPS